MVQRPMSFHLFCSTILSTSALFSASLLMVTRWLPKFQTSYKDTVISNGRQDHLSLCSTIFKGMKYSSEPSEQSSHWPEMSPMHNGHWQMEWNYHICLADSLEFM